MLSFLVGFAVCYVLTALYNVVLCFVEVKSQVLMPIEGSEYLTIFVRSFTWPYFLYCLATDKI